MKPKLPFFILVVLLLVSCSSKKETTEKYLRHFIEKHLQKTEQIYLKRNLAQWEALTSRNNEAMKKFEEIESNLLEKIVNPHGTEFDLEFYNTFNNYFYTDYEDFEYMRKIKESGYVEDTVLKRQLDLLYIEFLHAQIMLKQPGHHTEIDTEIDEHYSKYRFTIGNDSLKLSQLFSLLRKSNNPDTLKLAWHGISEAAVFPQEKILSVVKERNKIAEEFGFDNYYDLHLYLFEQDRETINKYLDALNEASSEVYKKLKKKIDSKLEKAFNISSDEIKPYHYQNISFTRLPKIINADYTDCVKDDADFKGKAKLFLNDLGLPSNGIIENSYINISDTNKHLFSFSLDIDNEGDSRLAVAAKPNFSGLRNFWHNLGHSVYEKYVPNDLPYQMRQPNLGLHESVATLFEYLILDSLVLGDLQLVDTESDRWYCGLSSNYLIRKILFAKYIQVLVRFEQALYLNPNQDLNKKWWQLVEEYMLINPPDNKHSSRWGYTNYVFGYDCYLQHYVIGMFAANQIKHDILTRYSKEPSKKPTLEDYGLYLNKFFSYGNSLYWRDLIKEVTNEDLTAKYYKEQLMKDFNQLNKSF